MKKGWRIACAYIMVYALSFGLTAAVMGTGREEAEPQLSSNASPVISEAAYTSSEPTYVIKGYNGVVAVFISGNDAPVIQTDILVSSLRNGDQTLMQKGIAINTYTEVLCLLEDLGS